MWNENMDVWSVYIRVREHEQEANECTHSVEGLNWSNSVLFVVTLKNSSDKESWLPLRRYVRFERFSFCPLAVSPLLTCTLFLAFRKRETIVFSLPLYTGRIVFSSVKYFLSFSFSLIFIFFLFFLFFYDKPYGQYYIFKFIEPSLSSFKINN